MDNIYQRVRHKTKDSIVKLEGILRPKAEELYYEKKADLYSLMKEKRKIDEFNVEKLIKNNIWGEHYSLLQYFYQVMFW